MNYPKKDKYVKKTQAKGMQADFQPCGMCKKQFRSKASLDQHIRVIHHKIKGQLISKCLLGVIVSTKIPTKKFDNFCPSS